MVSCSGVAGPEPLRNDAEPSGFVRRHSQGSDTLDQTPPKTDSKAVLLVQVDSCAGDFGEPLDLLAVKAMGDKDPGMGASSFPGWGNRLMAKLHSVKLQGQRLQETPR